MPRRTLEPLTEAMFYVLLCLHGRSMSGMEIAEHVERLTDGRVRLGPGTLYAILATFQKEEVAEKQVPEGRRIPYAITEHGEELYQKESARLRCCLADAEREEWSIEREERQDGDDRETIQYGSAELAPV